MGCNKKTNKFLLFVSCMLLSFVTYSQDSSNPQFSDYLVPVSNGPFEKNIHFNKEQENYSQHWKNAVQEELKSLLILQGTLESIQPLAVMVKNAFVIIGYVVGLLINYQGSCSNTSIR